MRPRQLCGSGGLRFALGLAEAVDHCTRDLMHGLTREFLANQAGFRRVSVKASARTLVSGWVVSAAMILARPTSIHCPSEMGIFITFRAESSSTSGSSLRASSAVVG